MVEEKIKKLQLKPFRIFKYNPDPKILTGEIEKLTNYSQRKRNLQLRIKMFKDKDDEQSKRQLESAVPPSNDHTFSIEQYFDIWSLALDRFYQN